MSVVDRWSAESLEDSSAVSLALAGVTSVLMVMNHVGGPAPIRMAFALVFVTFVPGWAILEIAGAVRGQPKVALAVALSFTVCTIVTLVPLWLVRWNPVLLLDLVGAASVAALLVRHLRGRSSA